MSIKYFGSNYLKKNTDFVEERHYVSLMSKKTLASKYYLYYTIFICISIYIFVYIHTNISVCVYKHKD